MARRLVGLVTLEDPDTRRHVTFEPGQDVPAWARALITNPAAWETDEGDDEGGTPSVTDGETTATQEDDGTVTVQPDSEDDVEQDDDENAEPPRSGAGSSVGAWTEYAQALGLTVTEDMRREDIIELVDARH